MDHAFRRWVRKGHFATRGQRPRAVQSRLGTGDLGARVDNVLIGEKETVGGQPERHVLRGVPGGIFGGKH
jgi:hypothetical protein